MRVGEHQARSEFWTYTDRAVREVLVSLFNLFEPLFPQLQSTGCIPAQEMQVPPIPLILVTLRLFLSHLFFANDRVLIFFSLNGSKRGSSLR